MADGTAEPGIMNSKMLVAPRGRVREATLRSQAV